MARRQSECPQPLCAARWLLLLDTVCNSSIQREGFSCDCTCVPRGEHTQKGPHPVITSFLPPHAATWNTNWHPMLHQGVHAETRLVPSEHLPGPVPVAAPQKGPHAAQVHRRWHVRHGLASNKSPKHPSRWTRNENQLWSTNLYMIDGFLKLVKINSSLFTK